MDGTLFDPNDLPWGTSVATVLRFNFLDAIDQFKQTLPADYVRDSWLESLQKQCSALHSQFSSEPGDDDSDRVSLLYLQVLFLKGLYRYVCGDAAETCGWEKMPLMLSPHLNGLSDTSQSPSDLFGLAVKATTEEDLLAYIAYGVGDSDRTAPTFITTACLVANRAALAGNQ
ncbi:hypothetical protein PG993_008682 [Apiospora rasikravindrae]|uniref:Uncharacterized protein n=1 Tax=Apiospora rasikravindrae TaxID=990691 RepID=A0ABR1SQU3_9PEZI